MLFIAGPGVLRTAAVQLRFAGGACRSYLIVHRKANGGSVQARPAKTWSESFADVAPDLGDLDLRRPDHVKRLERGLASLDLDALKSAVGN
jgi:hypothetical protein